MKSQTVAAAAVFTAFVAAATSVFSVSIPATNGYFNVGEIMVYTCALLMGPYVGAFAGGVGSAISDVTLGFSYYAPGTLVVKGAEGFIVGYLSRRAFAGLSVRDWKAITVGAGLLFGSALAYVGTTFLAGTYNLVLGDAWGIPGFEVDFQVPWEVWVGLGILVFVVIAILGLRMEAKSGQSVLSVLAGGAAMVSGYYLYESTVLRLIAPASVVATLAPAGEVPFNVAQALIGLLVAVPLVRSIRRVMRRAPADPSTRAP